MSILSDLKNVAGNLSAQAQSTLQSKIKSSGVVLSDKLSKSISKKLSKAGCKKKDITFDAIPETLDELMAVKGSDLKDPFFTAACAVVAFYVYVKNKEEGLKIMDYINGPTDTAIRDQQEWELRLTDKDYLPRSYFKGATPENNYAPKAPYTIHIEESPNSNQTPGYTTLYINCGGADSPRPVTLRKKESTGQWFLWQEMLTGDIRIPKAQDAWA